MSSLPLVLLMVLIRGAVASTARSNKKSGSGQQSRQCVQFNWSEGVGIVMLDGPSKQARMRATARQFARTRRMTRKHKAQPVQEGTSSAVVPGLAVPCY